MGHARDRGIRRVLIADDNADVRALARLTLEADEFEVVAEASNGAEAISATEDLHPDAVIIDVRMPVMDGLEATRALRDRFPDLRIVVMSGSDDPQVLKKITDAGADVAVDKTALADLVVHLDD